MKSEPLGYKIHQLCKMHRDTVRKIAYENGISQTRFYILDMLFKRTEVTQKEICEYVHLKAPTVSLTLQTMEQEEYIERVKSIEDSRKTMVRLSKKGLELSRQMKNYFDEADRLLENSVTKEELIEFNNIIEKMKEAMIRRK